MIDHTLPEPSPTGEIIPPALTILYQDDFAVAVDKPAGLLVHRSSVDKQETQFLLQRLRDQIGAHVFPVHRLDKPTSGVILFAKSPAGAAQLQASIDTDNRAGHGASVGAQKQYLLVCRGHVPAVGIVDHPLKLVDDFKRGKAWAESKPAQTAVTHYTRLHTIELEEAIDKYPRSRYSLVSANLITGRKHQLRRHFKHISHPIIGCPKYGKSVHNRYFAQTLGVPRLLLHAHRLCFIHPITQQKLTIEAPPSGSFAHLLERFQWVLPE